MRTILNHGGNSMSWKSLLPVIIPFAGVMIGFFYLIIRGFWKDDDDFGRED